jgi:hypothetical protein
MRAIIAGSRDNVTQEIVDKAIADSGWSDIIKVVVSGTARGADRMGENWAKRKGVAIDSKPADWDTYGKSAGYKRNQEINRMKGSLSQEDFIILCQKVHFNREKNH